MTLCRNNDRRRLDMRNKLVRSTVIAGVAVFGLPITAAAGDTFQAVNVVDFVTGTAVGGGATLIRSRQAVDVRIATSGLAPNAAYTLWWVVFNNPAACVGGCGADDVERPEVHASVINAAGFVTGTDRTANVTAHLEAGAPVEGIEVLVGSGLERGHGFRAEIHLVVRNHGPILPGRVAEQISRFLGGCDVFACADPQVAVFPPVQ